MRQMILSKNSKITGAKSSVIPDDISFYLSNKVRIMSNSDKYSLRKSCILSFKSGDRNLLVIAGGGRARKLKWMNGDPIQYLPEMPFLSIRDKQTFDLVEEVELLCRGNCIVGDVGTDEHGNSVALLIGSSDNVGVSPKDNCYHVISTINGEITHSQYKLDCACNRPQVLFKEGYFWIYTGSTNNAPSADYNNSPSIIKISVNKIDDASIENVMYSMPCVAAVWKNNNRAFFIKKNGSIIIKDNFEGYIETGEIGIKVHDAILINEDLVVLTRDPDYAQHSKIYIYKCIKPTQGDENWEFQEVFSKTIEYGIRNLYFTKQQCLSSGKYFVFLCGGNQNKCWIIESYNNSYKILNTFIELSKDTGVNASIFVQNEGFYIIEGNKQLGFELSLYKIK